MTISMMQQLRQELTKFLKFAARRSKQAIADATSVTFRLHTDLTCFVAADLRIGGA